MFQFYFQTTYVWPSQIIRLTPMPFSVGRDHHFFQLILSCVINLMVPIFTLPHATTYLYSKAPASLAFSVGCDHSWFRSVDSKSFSIGRDHDFVLLILSVINCQVTIFTLYTCNYVCHFLLWEFHGIMHYVQIFRKLSICLRK